MRNTILLTILSLSTFFVVISCGKLNEGQKSTKETVLPAFPVTQLEAKTVIGYQEYPTKIEGIVNSAVRAKTTGYIEKVLIDEGQKVYKGQVLFKLETQSLSQDADAAKALVELAEVEVSKLVPLVEKNIISPVQLEIAKANLAQAQASYNSITASIDYATVKSPINGFVGSIHYRQGSLVSPNDSDALTTVSDISKVYAFFSLNETQYLDFLQNTEGKNLKEKLDNFSKVSLVLANGRLYSEYPEVIWRNTVVRGRAH